MNFRPAIKTFALVFTLAAGVRALAVDGTNAAVPVTARDFYNAGTRLLAGKKYADAEKMFESALAAQDERVQPAALYNLGHTRFDEGVELLKKGPDAQKVAARGNAALAAGEQALRSGQSALAENDLAKMIAAYHGWPRRPAQFARGGKGRARGDGNLRQHAAEMAARGG